MSGVTYGKERQDALRERVRNEILAHSYKKSVQNFDADISSFAESVSPINGWQDAATMETYQKKAASMLERANTIKKYQTSQNAKYDTSQIDKVIEGLTETSEWLAERSEAFGGYESADDYNAAVKQYTDAEAKYGGLSSEELKQVMEDYIAKRDSKNADIDAQIAETRAPYDRLYNLTGAMELDEDDIAFLSQYGLDPTEIGYNKKAAAAVKALYEDTEAKIAELEKGRLAEADATAQHYYYQALLEEMGEDFVMPDRSSEEYTASDNLKEALSALWGNDETSEYWDAALRGTIDVEGNTVKSDFDKIFSMISDEDKRLYEYILDEQGIDAAYDYIKYLMYTNSDYNVPLVQKYAYEQSESKSTFEKIAGAPFQSYWLWAQKFGKAANALQGGEAIPNSADYYEYAFDNESLDGAAKMAHTVLGTAGENFVPIAVSWALGNVLGGAASALGAGEKVIEGATVAGQTLGNIGAFGVPIYGEAYNEARLLGYDEGTAQSYAVLSAASEVALERILGSMPGFGKTLSGDFIREFGKNFSSAIGRFAAEIGADAFGEFTEEYLQSVLEPVIRNAVLDENNEIKLVSADSLYAGIAGALSSLLWSGIGTASNVGQTKAVGSVYTDGKFAEGTGVQVLIDEGLTADPSSAAYKYAKKLSDKVAKGKTVTNFQAGVLTQMLDEAVEAGSLDGEKSSVTESESEQLIKDAVDKFKARTSPMVTVDQSQQGKNTAEQRQTIAEKIAAIDPEYGMRALWYAAFGTDSTADAAESISTNERKTEKQNAVAGKIEALEAASESNAEDDGRLDGYRADVETVTKAAEGLSGNSEMVAQYEKVNADAGDRARQNADVYVSDYTMVRDLAAGGSSEATIRRIIESGNGAGASLNEAQFLAAFYEGRALHDRQKGKKPVVDRSRPRRVGKVYYNGAQAVRVGDHVLSLPASGVSRGKKLNADQQAVVDFAEKVLAPMGVDVVLYSSRKDRSLPNGLYDGKNIYIDIEAGMSERASETFVTYALAHELTHMAERLSPELWQKYADAVLDILAREEGISIRGLMERRKLEYTDARIGSLKKTYPEKKDAELREMVEPLSDDGAIREIVADASQLIFTRESRFAEKLAEKDATLWDKIREMVLSAIRKIRGVLQSIPRDGVSEHLVGHLDELREYFDDMMADALYQAGYGTAEENDFFESALEKGQKKEKSQTTGKVQFSYAGRTAKTADKLRLATAERMIADGVDSDTVRKETGWFQGYDSEWRFEIDDSEAEVAFNGRFSRDPEIRRYAELIDKVYFLANATEAEQSELIDIDKRIGDKQITPDKLGDMLQHPELFSAYPQLADISVYFAEGTNRASYHPGFKEIAIPKRLKMNAKEFKKTLLHEVQHAVQDIEGFASGSNPEMFVNTYERSAYDQYSNTAGEIEARDVSARSDMTAEQRKNTRPDIDRENVVFARKPEISNGFVGWTVDSNEVYNTSKSIMTMSASDRISKFFNDFTSSFRGRTAKFKRNGHVHYARFGETKSELGKLAYEGKDPSSKSSDSGYKAKIRLLADGNIFELVEDSNYHNTEPERGKKQKAHKNAKRWDYYIKTVIVDGKGYDILINIRNDVVQNDYSTKEEYVYSIRFRDNKKVTTSVVHPATSKITSKLDAATDISIPQKSDLSTENSEVSENSGTQAQERRVDPDTDRQMLVRALEGAAKSEADRGIVKDYAERLGKYREMQKQLNDIRKDIDEMLEDVNAGLVHKSELNPLYNRANLLEEKLRSEDAKLLRMEALAPLHNLVEAERAKAREAEQAATREKVKSEKRLEAQKQAMENRQAANKRKAQERQLRIQYLARAERAISRLYRWTAHPTKKDHVPTDLLPYVKSLFEAVDVSHHFAQIEKLEEQLAAQNSRIWELQEAGAAASVIEAQEAFRDDLINRIKKLEGTQHNVTWADRLGQLGKIMSSVEKAQETSSIYVSFAPGLAEAIEKQVDTFTDDVHVRLFDASPEKIRFYAEAIESIAHSITEAGRLYANKRAAKVETLAELTIDEFRHERQEAAKPHVGAWARGFYGIDALSPAYFAHKLGHGAEAVMGGLFDGFYNTIGNVRVINEFSDRLREKYKVSSFTGKNNVIHHIKLEQGGAISLTTTQLMTVYALSDRTQAQKHMFGRGIQSFQGNIDEAVRKTQPLLDSMKDEAKRWFEKEDSDMSKFAKMLLGSIDIHKLTQKDVDGMIDLLTGDQKACVKEIKTFLHDVVAPMGNKTSQTLYLYDMFTEDNYFPIETVKTYLRPKDKDMKDGDIDTRSIFSILNQGFTKNLSDQAGNPIVIRDIFDVFMEHCFGMANYGGLGVAVSDTIKWLSYRQAGEGSTLRDEMKKAWGTSAERYIRNLLMSIEGELKGTDGARAINKLVRNAKIASVAGNARVVLQQPTAYFRAGAVLSPKSMLNASIHPFDLKKMIEEATEHSELMYYKSLGFYDMNNSQSLLEKMKGDKSMADRIREWTTAPAGAMDMMTWGTLWRACRLEIDSEIREKGLSVTKNSDEYFRMVRDKFHEVINLTQVIDSPMHKNKLMSDPDSLMKQLTAFMAEPMLTLNMVQSAVDDVHRKRPGGKVKLVRASVVFLLSTAATGVMSAFADAARDDDDDEGWMEKYLEAALRNITGVDLDDISVSGILAGDWNLLNNMPLIKEFFSILEGYDPSRMELSGMEKMVQAMNKVYKFFSGEGPGDFESVMYSIAQVISAVSGIPVSNLWRLVRSMVNTFRAWAQ